MLIVTGAALAGAPTLPSGLVAGCWLSRISSGVSLSIRALETCLLTLSCGSPNSTLSRSPGTSCAVYDTAQCTHCTVACCVLRRRPPFPVLTCYGGACGAATIKTTHALSLLRTDPAQQTPNLLSLNLGKRWRAERNFWISFLCFTLWWCASHPPRCWTPAEEQLRASLMHVQSNVSVW